MWVWWDSGCSLEASALSLAWGCSCPTWNATAASKKWDDPSDEKAPWAWTTNHLNDKTPGPWKGRANDAIKNAPSYDALKSSQPFLTYQSQKRICPRHHGLAHRTSCLNGGEVFSETCEKDIGKRPRNDLSFAYSHLDAQQEPLPSERLSRARRKSAVRGRLPSFLQRRWPVVLPLVSLARRAVVLLDATVIPPGFLLVKLWLTSMLVPSPKPLLFCLLSKILLVDCQFLLLNLVQSPSQKKKLGRL